MFDASVITGDVVQRITQHYQQIERSLTWPAAEAGAAPEFATPLHADIARFVQIANGQIDRVAIDDQSLGEIIERFQRLLDLLFAPASGFYSYTIPPSFWTQTAIGQALAHVQAWLRRDDLIGYTEAAQLLFPELALANIQAARMRAKRMVERGELMVYIDPSEPNPTQQARLSRQAIEALRAAGRIHDERPLTRAPKT
jgi:hypothetical protein